MSDPQREVLRWAKRICATRNAPAHQVLAIPADATLEIAQQAFHDVARTGHPDLHRALVTPEELEVVTAAFSLVAASYQQFRSQRSITAKLPPAEPPRPRASPSTHPPYAGVLVAEPLASPAMFAAQQMSSRALVHYRKAEQSLRRGDLPEATLYLKMAIASDPTSTLLRTALRELESESPKKP